MTELIAGTKKGLFFLEGDPGAGVEINVRAFAGEPVDFATRDPRSKRLLATVTSPFYGPKIFYTDGDPGGSGSRPTASPCAKGRSGARANLGHRPWRGRRNPLRGGKSRGPAREPRRRSELADQRRAMEAALARATAARWWWALPALDLDLAGRSRPVGGRRLGRRDEADRGRRPNLAAREREAQPGLPSSSLTRRR